MQEKSSRLASFFTHPKTYPLTILCLILASIFTIIHNFFLFPLLDTPTTRNVAYNTAQPYLTTNQNTPVHILASDDNYPTILPADELTLRPHAVTPVDTFTVITPSEQPYLSLEKLTTSTIATTNVTTSVTETTSTPNTYTPPVSTNYLVIGGRTSNIFFVDDYIQSFPDSGTQVASYHNTFFYAHSTGPFSNLAAQPDGTVFTITLDNITHSYVFDHQETLTVDEANAKRSTIYYAEYNPAQISLMTCAGTYDNSIGTYTHRLIRYARRID